MTSVRQSLNILAVVLITLIGHHWVSPTRGTLAQPQPSDEVFSNLRLTDNSADALNVTGGAQIGGNMTIGDATEADKDITFDGNAQDFYIALDDSADDLVIGLGATVGTTPALAIDENLDLTLGDATESDIDITFDGNAQDFYIALDDSEDDLVIGLGATVGTTPILSLDENQNATFTNDVTADTITLTAGTGSGTYKASGVIDVDSTQAGTDANTDEKTLRSYTLPANTLATDKDAIRWIGVFTIPANGNTKTIRFKFGGTTVIAPTGTINNGKVVATITVTRTGATAQDASGYAHSTQISGGISPSVGVTTASETLSGAVTMLITGQNGSSSANDIVYETSSVEYLPAP